MNQPATQSQHTPRLILVDGSGYIFRAYHALPPLTRPDGVAVGAVYGFTTMLMKLREQYANDRLVVIFDAGRANFRNDIYPEYKAHRPPAPDDLIPQFALVREATRALNVPAIEMENYEADDLIASYAAAARAEQLDVVIVSSDKDLMQLIRDGVAMSDPMKQKSIGAAEVFEKFGVTPEKIVEVQALIGDPTDNVPGVPGIGPKTAAELITQFGTLDNLMANLAQIKQPKRRESLMQNVEAVRISRQLVQLKHDVPLPAPLSEFVIRPIDPSTLQTFLQAQNFNALMKRLGMESGTRHPALVAGSPEAHSEPVVGDLGLRRDDAVATHYETIHDENALQRWIDDATRTGLVAFDTETTGLDASEAELVGISLATAAGRACYIPVGHRGERKAVQSSMFDDSPADCVDPGISSANRDDTLLPNQLPLTRVLEMLAPLLMNPSVLKIGHNIKYDLVVLKKYAVSINVASTMEIMHGHAACPSPAGGGPNPSFTDSRGWYEASHPPESARADSTPRQRGVAPECVAHPKEPLTITPLADTMLMSYCLSAGPHGLDALAMQHFGHKMIAFSEVTGTGKNQKNFSEIAIEAATNYAAEDADFTFRLYEKLSPEIARQRVATVYETIERPLIPIIADMEWAGILVDPKILIELSREFAVKLETLEREVIALAGMEFSVGSPKQLGEVLFEKLQLPGGKKSAKSGAYTTDAETLESLAEQGHDIARKVLEWRQFAKLKSTYTDALVKQISPRDGRVHTSYSMVGASTGRLSSNDPNLQNIPIRTEEGRRIRTAFIAPKEYQLISADYSQIELRLLAHMADIAPLKEAFRNGIDIHAVTASQMFGVPVDQVTPELRRRAKTINFGIIYGISAHGLATRLGISRQEAATYIDSYFKQYPGIREYMDRTIATARAQGFVTTLYGRKIHLRDINAKNPALRQFSERAAINAPLQGTAADIIKRAMVEVAGLLNLRESILVTAVPPQSPLPQGGRGLGEGAAKSAHSFESPSPNLSPLGGEGYGGSPLSELSTRLLLQVHDELIFEVPEAEAAALAQKIKRAMEQVAHLSIPLTVEVGIGAHWGAIH